jgi:hypothetical protein
MANVKITDLTEDTSPADGDWVETVDVSASSSKKVTRTNFFKDPPLGAGSVDSEALKCTVGFHATVSGVQSIPNNTITTIEFDTEVFDIGSDYNTGTYTFTCPVTGYYHFTAGAGIVDVSDGNGVQVYIFKNGATFAAQVCYSAAGVNNPNPNVSIFTLCTSGDEISVSISHDDGSASNLTTSTATTYFCGYLVGAA